MTIARRLGVALVIAAVAISMAVPPTVMAASGRFVDDNRSPFEAAIETVTAARIMTPCNPPRNDRFCPDATINRGHMAVILARAFQLTATSGVRFRDAPRSGALAVAIDRVVTAGIAKACAPDRFCPATNVTRGRMAQFLASGLHLSAIRVTPFKDVKPGTSVATSINRLATAGLAPNCGGGRFCPTRAITRAETAGFLARVIGVTRVTTPQPDPGNPHGSRSGPRGCGTGRHVVAGPRRRQRDAGELHLAGRGQRRRGGRRDHVRLRPGSRSRSRWLRPRESSTTGRTS